MCEIVNAEAECAIDKGSRQCHLATRDKVIVKMAPVMFDGKTPSMRYYSGVENRSNV